MDPGVVVAAAAAVLSGLLAIALAIAVARSGLHTTTRPLFTVLLLEGVFQIDFALAFLFPGDAASNWIFPTSLLLASGLAFAYFAVLAQLTTPLVSFLRRPGVLPVLGIAAIAPVAAGVGYAAYVLLTGQPEKLDDSILILVALLWMLTSLLVASIFGLVASISAFRRSAPGTTARKRAGAFVAAFGARDGIFVTALILSLAEEALGANIWVGGELMVPFATLAFVPLLAYGILRSQLFDIDLKIKLGISRGTVVGIILVAVFVGAKIVESYLNRTAGFIAGSIVAGSLLFLVPKLNKVGDKVANTAMPQVQPTSGYVQFKKLEVYRAAVESAQETGGIGERERASLDRLRGKLALDPADCAAVEAEVVPPV